MATKQDKDIEHAIAALRAIGANYKPREIKIPDYSKSIEKQLQSIKITPMDWSGYGKASLTPIKSDKKSKGIPKINLWDVLSGTLGQPGGLVTDYASGIIGKAKKFDPKHPLDSGFDLAKAINPTSVLKHAAVNGAKEQWKDWTDGKLTWGNIPGVGVLHGMDKGYKRGEDIMKQFGVKNRWGKVGGGLAIDIALDPLTYLTGGASLAGKASKAKELEKVMEISKAMKLPGKIKDTQKLKSVARDTLKKKYPNLSDNIINKRVANIGKEVTSARNIAYNKNINSWGVSLPFSSKSKGIGKISEKSLLYRSEAKLNKFAHVADNLIDQAAKTPEAKKKVLEAVKKMYGVAKLEDLTKSHLSDLTARLKPVIKNLNKGLPDAKITENLVKKEMPNEIFDIASKKGRPNETLTYSKTSIDDILKSLNPVVAQKLEPMLQGLNDVEDIRKLAPEATKMFGEFAPKILKTVKGKTAKIVSDEYASAADKLANVTHKATLVPDAPIQFDELERAAQIFKKGTPETAAMKGNRDIAKAFEEPYSGLFDGRTKLEHWLDKRNPFDARTLKTGDEYVDSMANQISDMNSQKVGNMAKHHSSLGAIEKFIKRNGLTQDDKMAAIYHLEGKAPKSMPNFAPNQKQLELANMIKPFLDKVAKGEKADGILTNTRENYFPHMLNKDAKDIKKIIEFKKKNGSLNGLSQEMKNNKSRTSFDTMADRDNYLAKLEKQIQKETDPTKKQELIEQQKQVADLFDTDVVSALTRRVREGIRSKAIKDMQGELSKFGMFKTNPEGAEHIRGLKRLTDAESKKFGLGDGQHYMHPDVLDGMKRIDDIFTNEGMNKTVRHLNAVTNIFRAGVTTFKLSHYRNNIIGNTINNMAAGVTVNDYTAARKLIKAAAKGKLTDAQSKIMDAAYSHNVMSGGFVQDMAQHLEFKDPLMSEKIADKLANNKVAKKIRAGGEKVDDYFRLANFIGGLDKTGNVKKAAGQVREYLFNYNEMTNADRNMRVAIPFWNWTKRNIPLQVKLLMENPKVAMNVERFKELFNEEMPGADWQKDMGINLPGTGYYTSLPSPTDDLNTLLNPLSLLGSMAPVPKMLLETQQNRQFFNDRPITYGQDTVDPADLPEYLSKQFGVTGNVYDAVSGKKTPGEALINYLNPIYATQE